MSAEINTETTAKEQPKSKRLSSFIWIFGLWGFIRLISELDHISWKRSFPTDVVIFGLWPATLFLVLAATPWARRYESLLRWAALVAVLGSFSFLFFFQQQSDAIACMVIFQRSLVVVVLCCVVINWRVKREVKND
jgi:hypothetical protein